MGKIYKSGVPYSGGGGGTSTDYNNITNTPIKNLEGTSSGRFINFAGLDVGKYHFKGYFKIDISHELQNITEFIDLTVVHDTKTNKKTIQYFTIEDGTFYSNLVVYSNGIAEKIEKTPMNGQGGEVEIHWGDMTI